MRNTGKTLVIKMMLRNGSGKEIEGAILASKAMWIYNDCQFERIMNSLEGYFHHGRPIGQYSCQYSKNDSYN